MTWGRQVGMKRQLPMRLTSSCSASTSGSRWRRAPAVAMPALAIATSIPPQRSTMSATAPATAAPSVMSHAAATASPPSCAAARSAPSPSMSSRATRCVAWSRRAVSRPMPRAAPGTTATGGATGGGRGAATGGGRGRGGGGRLLGAGAPGGRVGLVLGALAHHLGDGECDEALHEHREDDEEHEDQPERGGEGAQGDDHDAAER